MKRALFAALLISIRSFLFAQENPGCEWIKHKITVDGNAGEWDPPLKNYDTGTRLFFDFKNDSSNLYLCFQTRDGMTEAKIMRSGMKIILSDKIHGKHKLVIDFPMAASKSAAGKDEIQPDPMAPGQSTHAVFLSKDTLMKVEGFAAENGIISTRKTSGIHPAVNWDSARTFTYEIAIPFKEMFGNDFEIKHFSKNISLEVIINAMPAGTRSQYGSDGNEFSGRGSTYGGGRMGGGGYSGMDEGGNRMRGGGRRSTSGRPKYPIPKNGFKAKNCFGNASITGIAVGKKKGKN